MKTTAKTIMLLMAMIISLSSCNKDDDTGSVQVKVTDDPFPFEFVRKADLKITKVELKNTDNEYVTVFEGNANVNMVNYRNGATANIGVKDVPPGTYKGARVTIDGAEVELSNGTNFSVNANANAQVETPITPNFSISAKEEQAILLDIDLSDSFVFQGAFGGWISDVAQITGISSFTPDVRVANLNASGAVSGVVKDNNGDVVANAEAYVKYDYDGDGLPEKVSTVTEANGSFKIIGLPAGDYTLHVEAKNNKEASANVTVNVDNVASVDLTVN